MSNTAKAARSPHVESVIIDVMRHKLELGTPSAATIEGIIYLADKEPRVFKSAEANALMAKAYLLVSGGDTTQFEYFRKAALNCNDCSDEMKRALLNLKVAWTNVTDGLRWLPRVVRFKLARWMLRNDYPLNA